MSDKKPCPNCGHCPTCGKGNYPKQYWPWTYPYYPPSHPWVYGTGTTNPIKVTYTSNTAAAAN